MTIRDVAQRDVVTAHPGQSAGNLATVMKEENVGSVIIQEDRRPVGIVTDRDLAMEVLEPRADPRTVTAEELMTENPITVEADVGIFEATKLLFEAEVRRLPVVDDGEIVGIITLDDFLVLFTDELNGLAGVVEAESPHY